MVLFENHRAQIRQKGAQTAQKVWVGFEINCDLSKIQLNNKKTLTLKYYRVICNFDFTKLTKMTSHNGRKVESRLKTTGWIKH